MATSCYFHFMSPPRKNELQHSLSKHDNPRGTLGEIDPIVDVCANIDPSMTTTNNNTTMPKGVTNENGTNGSRTSCKFCHRQIRGLKIDALRGEFLASFSDSLLDRVRRLERDLSLAETHSKNANNSRDNISKRLQAYERFVAEMLSTIDTRGIVQLTDEKGNEIILQRVKDENHSTSDYGRNSDFLEKEIVSLKNTIKNQQKTINDMIELRNLYGQRKEPAKRIDREIQTNSSPEFIAALENYDKAVEKLDENLKKLSSKVQKVKNNENPNIVSNVAINEGGSPKCRTEEKSALSKHMTEPRVLKIRKPSGILLQGKNVKFAIIRL